jgi:hypothetical protein
VEPFSGANKIPSTAPAANPASTPKNTFPELIIEFFKVCYSDNNKGN